MESANKSSEPFLPPNMAVSAHTGDTQESSSQCSSQNRWRVWSESRDKQLRDFVEGGKSSREIASEMNSTLHAIITRRSKLKIKSPRTVQRAALRAEIRSQSKAGFTRKQIILNTGATRHQVDGALVAPRKRKETETKEKMETLRRMIENKNTQQEIATATDFKLWRVGELVREL